MTSTRLPFGGRRRVASRDPVFQITGARRGVRDDVNSRTRRYLYSMGVRTACFVLAVLADGWLRWVLISGAIVLPYLSVVFANGGRERVENLPDAAGLPEPSQPPRAIGGSGS